jgi:hypothetical protein
MINGDRRMEERSDETLILEIPIGGQVPSMITPDEYKTEMFKWLDDKPCLYFCIGSGENYLFIINGMRYVVREWI